MYVYCQERERFCKWNLNLKLEKMTKLSPNWAHFSLHHRPPTWPSPALFFRMDDEILSRKLLHYTTLHGSITDIMRGIFVAQSTNWILKDKLYYVVLIWGTLNRPIRTNWCIYKQKQQKTLSCLFMFKMTTLYNMNTYMVGVQQSNRRYWNGSNQLTTLRLLKHSAQFLFCL